MTEAGEMHSAVTQHWTPEFTEDPGGPGQVLPLTPKIKTMQVILWQQASQVLSYSRKIKRGPHIGEETYESLIQQPLKFDDINRRMYKPSFKAERIE